MSIVNGVSRFLEHPHNMLKKSLRSKKPGDILHINSGGHGLLVRLIKDELFSRRQGVVDGRMYSNIVKSGGRSGKTS